MSSYLASLAEKVSESMGSASLSCEPEDYVSMFESRREHTSPGTFLTYDSCKTCRLDGGKNCELNNC